MPSSCKDIRAALAECLQNSDCVMIERNKASDCLRPPLVDTLPTKCQQLKRGYGECKRGLVDMRKRFRGNQPIAVSQEIEGGSQASSGQLYAGRPAFSSGVKVTDGREDERANSGEK
ncbi:MAG: hypothetical protein M1829_002126 [Trizodia sp. TS-e1964]|nr:MAG: hypothetical protein M1829_002126 [Trizodia sp. TS-e1964]